MYLVSKPPTQTVFNGWVTNTHTNRGKEVLSLLEEFANLLFLQKSKMASNQKWKKVEKRGNSLSYVGYHSPPWKSRMPCDHKMVQNQYLNATTSLSISSRCLVLCLFSAICTYLPDLKIWSNKQECYIHQENGGLRVRLIFQKCRTSILLLEQVSVKSIGSITTSLKVPRWNQQL